MADVLDAPMSTGKAVGSFLALEASLTLIGVLIMPTNIPASAF